MSFLDNAIAMLAGQVGETLIWNAYCEYCAWEGEPFEVSRQRPLDRLPLCPGCGKDHLNLLASHHPAGTIAVADERPANWVDPAKDMWKVVWL